MPPLFSKNDAETFALELFNVRALAKLLPSERDQNFLLTTPDKQRFVLKIANAAEAPDFLKAQHALMTWASSLTVVPQVVPNSTGEMMTTVTDAQGTAYALRLLTFIEGVPLAQLPYHSEALLYDIGHALGQLDGVLEGFDHPAAHRVFDWDSARAAEVIEAYQSEITDQALQVLVMQAAEGLLPRVEPLLPTLRRSVIHGDANDYNVIIKTPQDTRVPQDKVAGFIDFGDMLHTITVSNVAVACAYAMLDKPDPLHAAACVLRGYHEAYPLTEDEVHVLWGLIGLRLCVSAVMAAKQAKSQPNNAYLTVSQGPVRRLLPQLCDTPYRLAEAHFRLACGLPPVAEGPDLVAYLRENKDTYAPVIRDIQGRNVLAGQQGQVVDWSMGSPLISNQPEDNTEPKLSARVWQTLNGQIGIGRYGEVRPLYTGKQFRTDDLTEARNVHLGTDLFAPAGTAIYVPLEGVVHLLGRNTEPLDYGPLVVLRHTWQTPTGEREVFFTLYGHLSVESLATLRVGQWLASGDVLGYIGEASVNGGWTPHLHLQFITDLLGLGLQFPGVCRFSQQAVWMGFSLDPSLIVTLPKKALNAEPSKEQTLKTRRQYFGGNVSLTYQEPIHVVRGYKQYLFDNAGRQYLDAYNNVPHVGHSHERITEAAVRQMRLVNTNTRYLSDISNAYAEALVRTFPEPLRVCYILNSASEANELALRLARAHTQAKAMIVLEAAYHGNTTSLIDISPYKHAGPGGEGTPAWVRSVPIPDTYRGLFKADDPEAGARYAEYVNEAIESLIASGQALAGFIAESCPSVGGQIMLPAGYLTQVYRMVRQAGGVCIADEVQTGYGRIGTHMYAFEQHSVVPDIVVLGKPIGNGYPLAAVITTLEIAQAFDNGMEFFSTFGGNTVASAVGLAQLQIVTDEVLQAHALVVGKHLLTGLRTLQSRHDVIGDVRGSGLFLGVELVREHTHLTPAMQEARYVKNRMRQKDILIDTDGPYDNVLKIRPPMPFTKGDADRLLEVLDRVLTELF